MSKQEVDDSLEEIVIHLFCDTLIGLNKIMV